VRSSTSQLSVADCFDPIRSYRLLAKSTFPVNELYIYIFINLLKVKNIKIPAITNLELSKARRSFHFHAKQPGVGGSFLLMCARIYLLLVPKTSHKA